MYSLFNVFAHLVLAVSSWLTPQPKLSIGLLVVYGNHYLTEANADYHWHGYRLQDTGGCGLASISPLMLGQLAYISVDNYNWRGPCRVVDVVAQKDAADSILVRHEIAEIDRKDALAFGFTHGQIGYIWFDACPPPFGEPAYSFTVPPVFVDTPTGGPNIYNSGYPARTPVQACFSPRTPPNTTWPPN